MTRRLLPYLLFAAFAAASFGAIRSYDFFWQLATGRWIVEHRALPLTDPFALASERTEWIDGEWLYEVLLYGAHSLLGLTGLSFVRGLLCAAIFTCAFLFARRSGDGQTALLATSVAFAGAVPLLDLRPSAVAALLLVLMLGARTTWVKVLIAIVWVNVHPSALLAPMLSVGRASARLSGGVGGLKPALRSATLCAIALLCNPHGYKAILAPIQLTSFVSSGAFVNAEWLPSSPGQFPLLYLAIATAVALYALQPKRDWFHIALLAMFAFLAVRHVRNQPLFFAALPLLIPLPPLRPAIAYAGATLAVLLIGISTDHRLGVPPERFPVKAVAQLKAANVKGNIYNADQFGGYLIWTFYPERRVLTDGRNELYRTFIPAWQQAREDSRKWNALLKKYDIAIAVEEHRPPLRVIDARTGRPTEMPAHLAYWPKNEWVMIAEDEAAMVFVSSRARGGR
ncbi:MAG TPA: hypothetical protein VEO54_08550 [Thermoanaerobaculia bacterium]|nr:hypothetical protein [Thermoanaerobaculia bacterium]